MTQDPIRHYVVLDTANEDVRTGYFNPNARAADIWARSYIGVHVYGPAVVDPPFDVIARPSRDLTADLDRPKIPSEVVVAVSTAGGDRRTSEEVIDDIIRAAHEKPHIFAGSSPDIPFAALDHWCMADASDPVFSDRSGAERLLGVDYLREQNQTTGRGVNVVIVDQGLDRQVLGDRYGDGWLVGTRQPGSPPPRGGSVRRSHGMMIAHNVLKVAPEATLFDLPLAPTKISDIQAFLSDADAAFRKMLSSIADWKSGKYPGPWILVNPWGSMTAGPSIRRVTTPRIQTVLSTSSLPRRLATTSMSCSRPAIVASSVRTIDAARTTEGLEAVSGAPTHLARCLPSAPFGPTERGSATHRRDPASRASARRNRISARRANSAKTMTHSVSTQEHRRPAA